MRNLRLNLTPANRCSTFFTFLLILFLTACQKEGTQELETELSATATEEKMAPETITPTADEVIELEWKQVPTESANSRSATTLEYQAIYNVSAGNWQHLYYPKVQLPDPTVWRVDVEVRPISGDPDLYIYGYDNHAASPWRYVRSSGNGGLTTERTSYRASGLKSIEEYMYMSVYGYTNARYEILISFTTVDCVEYPTANQFVTLEYNPVCGCDGNEYGNPSSAFVNGVTSWTMGPCNSVNGLWRNIDANTRGITKMRISNNARTIHLYGACSPTDCDWETEVLTYDGRCYSAKYEHGFATRYIKLHQQPDGHMKMEMLTDYHDSRTDRRDIYYFR